MKLTELDSFKMSDAVVLHDTLNPALFDGEHLRPDVRAKLLEIAEEFIDYLGVSNLDVKDITISGSNAAYSYTPHSDIDLHIIADLAKFNNDEIYRELFTAKKNLFNADHNIKIKGYDVELYVQDTKKPVRSLGEYSVERNKWIKFPSKQRANLDHHSVENKFKKLVQLGQLALRSTDMEALGDVLSTIRRYRQAGLDEHGEFGPENLAYKALRSQGIVDKLYNHMDALKSRQLSLDEQLKLFSESLNNFSKKVKHLVETAPSHKQYSTDRVVKEAYHQKLLRFVWEHRGNINYNDFMNSIMKCAWGSKFLSESANIDDAKKLISKFQKIDVIKLKPGSIVDIVNISVNSATSVIGITVILNQQFKGYYVDPNKTILFKAGDNLYALKSVFASETFFTLVTPPGKAEESLTMIGLMTSYVDGIIKYNDWIIDMNGQNFATRFNDKLNEASGYIPSEKERNDPRFKTALTVDVHPDSIQQNAKKLGSKIARSGVPPILKASGKI